MRVPIFAYVRDGRKCVQGRCIQEQVVLECNGAFFTQNSCFVVLKEALSHAARCRWPVILLSVVTDRAAELALFDSGRKCGTRLAKEIYWD
jgi:hypothetical protein